MPAKPATRREAARNALIAKIACVALLTGVVAIALLGRGPAANPGANQAASDTSEVRLEEAKIEDRVEAIQIALAASAPTTDDGPRFDIDTIASGLGLAADIRKPEPPKPADTAEDPVDVAEDPKAPVVVEQDPEPESEAIATYIGMISAGDKRLGLFKIGDRQVMVAEGSSKTISTDESEDPLELEVVTLLGPSAVIRENGQDHDLAKAAKSEDATPAQANPQPRAAAAKPNPRANDPRRNDARRRARTNQANNDAQTAAENRSRLQEAVNLPRPPRAEDFERDNGTIDREGYNKALQEYTRQRREAIQQRRGQGGRSRSFQTQREDEDRDGQ